MDLPSEWEWYWKLIAVVLFIAIMGTLAWVLRRIVPIIPDQILSHLVIGGAALAIGFLWGQRSIRRHFEKLGYGPPPDHA